MTADEYRGAIRAMGLTAVKPAYDGGTLYEDRDGQFHTLPNPENLSATERKDLLELRRTMLGLD